MKSNNSSGNVTGYTGYPSPRAYGLLMLLVPLAIAWWFVAAALFGQWIKDPNYTHGLFVVPMAALLAFRRRRRVLEATAEPSYWGLAVLGAAIVLYLTGILAAELFTMRVSMVLALIGVVLATQGAARTRALLFPLLFLFLMIPLPYVIYYKFTFPMQLWSSRLAAAVLSGLGMPVVRSGNVIRLEDYTLEVVTACSGLRSMMSLGTLAVFMTDFFRIGKPVKVALVLLSIPVAIVANTIRLVSTAVVSGMAGPGEAKSYLHGMSGVVVFMSGLVLLVILGFILEWIARRRSSSSRA
ncbi:MAG: exosortase/archaeosortase family protein [Candidatus Latescibacterota bacterium]|jgi:exosortase